MARAINFVAACAVTISAWASTTTAWAADQLAVPAGARIGIIVMMRPDVTHYHVGKTQLASFMRTYRINWPVSEMLHDPLAATLKGMGFAPVFLDPTEPLRRKRQSWFVEHPLADTLPRAARKEIEKILETARLDGLVIVAPGVNADPASTAGNRLRELPSYLRGWGFSTSDEPGGIARPAVFNLTQMLIIGRSADSPELIFREWDGAFAYEWSGFQPGRDLKALSTQQVARLRPVIKDILQKQIGRLTPRIKVAK